MPELTYKDKLFHHKLAVIYRRAIIVAIVIAIALICKISYDNRVYTETKVVEKIKKMGTENATYEAYEGNILIHSTDGISVYDAKGKQIWNKTYEMQNPIVRKNKEYVAVGDYKGNKIYIMNATGPTGEVETNLPIMDLDVSAKGIVAATLQDDSVTWVKLFSAEGVEISDVKTTMKQSGYPLAVSISPDNVKLGISYLKAQSGEINTSIAFYNFGAVGQNETDHLVSGKDFTNAMAPYLSLVDTQNAIAICDQKLLYFKGKEKPSLANTVDLGKDVVGIYHDESYIGIVFHNTDSKEAFRLDVYDLSGNLKYSHIFDISYSDIIMNDGYVIIYNDSHVQILGPTGRLKYDGDMGGGIVSLIPTSSKLKYLLVKGQKIEMVKLQ